MKRWSQRCLGSLVVLALASVAPAQLQSLQPFTGGETEDFEGPQVIFLPCIPQRIFNNNGDMCTPGNSGCHTTTSFSYFCTIYSHGGSWFYSSVGGSSEITLDQTAQRFGGWFGTNANMPDATFDFYDASNALIQSVTGSVPADCQWHWLGWQATAQPIKRIVVTSNGPSGAFLDMDDLQVDFGVPQPTAYCTPGTTVHGCTATISASANPRVGYNSPCQIVVSGVEGQRTGIVFYGLTQLIQPWCSLGGGTSFLCVKTPTMRCGPQNTGGTTGACDGTLSLDWNAFQLSTPGSLGSPWVTGEKAYAQGWFRDPGNCKPTSMSNAIELTYVP